VNEAKDNLKYLSTLQRFIELLYSGTAQSIIDTLPVLINSIKVSVALGLSFNSAVALFPMLISFPFFFFATEHR
jgi:dynein heavy chain